MEQGWGAGTRLHRPILLRLPVDAFILLSKFFVSIIRTASVISILIPEVVK